MARYAKVVEKKVANITKPKGYEIYYAFRIVVNKQGIICGHYTTKAEAEEAAHAYRCGENHKKLVCKQTKKLIHRQMKTLKKISYHDFCRKFKSEYSGGLRPK